MKKIKEMFGSPQSRYGTYSTLLAVVVIGIVIAINIAANYLPKGLKNIDLSSSHLYKITEQSKDLIKGLDKKVEIHILADKKTADQRIVMFVDKYAALSRKVSVKWTDPALHPTVLTETGAGENAVIVTCEDTGKSTTFSLADMIEFDEYAYYSSGQYQETGFDAEGQLTGAIHAVVSDATYKVYYTAGHGEMALSAMITDLFAKANITTAEVNTLTEQSIPKDCELLFLNAPATDFMETEIEMLVSYMKDGGNILYVMHQGDGMLTNLNGFLAEYGLEVQAGLAADTQSSIQQNPYYIIPTLSVNGNLAAGLKSKATLMLYPKAIKEITPARETIAVEAFMQTSEKGGYVVTEEKQEQGTSILGAIATEEKARLTVFTSSTFIDEGLAKAYSTLENMTLFMNAVISNFESATNVSIPAKSLGITYNTMQNVGVFSFAVMLGAPVVVLGVGFATWLKRRKA